MTVDMKTLIKLAKESKALESIVKPSNESRITNSVDTTQLGVHSPSVVFNCCSSITGVSISNDFLPISVSDMAFAYLESVEPSFTQLRGRKCRQYGGKVCSSGLIVADDIPEWLKQVMNFVHQHVLDPLNFPCPNHALVNVYEPGEGIMAHEDGPSYTPYATVLSLGSASVFDFVSKDLNRTTLSRILLPCDSLLFFTEDAYTNVLHAFPSSKVDDLTGVMNTSDISISRLGTAQLFSDSTLLRRGKRISITMRHVRYCENNKT